MEIPEHIRRRREHAAWRKEERRQAREAIRQAFEEQKRKNQEEEDAMEPAAREGFREALVAGFTRRQARWLMKKLRILSAMVVLVSGCGGLHYHADDEAISDLRRRVGVLEQDARTNVERLDAWGGTINQRIGALEKK